jgi:hypothetical protein
VPGFPPAATLHFDITRRGVLDHVQRVALRAFALDGSEFLSADAIDQVVTLGELWTLVGGIDSTSLAAARSQPREPYATPRVRLAPLEPTHYAVLYRAAVQPSSAYRWRWRGRTPSPDEFQATLFSGVTSQYVVVGGQGSLIAFLRASEDEATDRGGMVEGIALFIAYLFETFPYERLFADVPEYNVPLLEATGAALLQREGAMRRYFWHGGRHWDRVFFSLAREDWAPIGQALFGHLQVSRTLDAER